MPIVAIYYGSSASDVNTITSYGQVQAIVLENTGYPYNATYNSTVYDMVHAAQLNGTLAIGYVDSGTVELPGSWTSSTTYSGPCGSGSYGGGTCSVISRAITSPQPYGSSNHWCHRAYDSTDVDFSTVTNNYTYYYDFNYGSGGPYNLRKQSPATGYQCATMNGYMKDFVDLWCQPHDASHYGADGIFLDNAFVGSPNDVESSSTGTGSPYQWYTRICNDMKTHHNVSYIILNAGGPPAQWWFTHTTTDPVFDLITVGEETYLGSGNHANYPPKYGYPDGMGMYKTLPSYITASAQTYAPYFMDILKGASGISSSDTSAWITACCNNGIAFSFIATDSGGNFGTVPSNMSTQDTDASGTSCSTILIP